MSVSLSMCPPTHFEVGYTINPWMEPSKWARDAAHLKAKAAAEWRCLRSAYEKAGARVEVAESVLGRPDMVFTANSAVVLDRRVLLARFRHPERQGEEKHFARFYEGLAKRGLFDEVATLPEGCFQEGAGDCVWDSHRNLFWCAHGPRSVPEAAEQVERFFGVEVVRLHLVQPHYYHLDVCICPLPRGHVIVFPSTLSPDSLACLKHKAGEEWIVEAGETDAATLAINAFAIGDDVFTSGMSRDLSARLGTLGYRVHDLDLATFKMSGGSAFCLTLRLDFLSRGTIVRHSAAARA